MDNTSISQRQTKYCQAILAIISNMGHATNSELLIELRKNYSYLSATTVHRATARLASRGAIALAPSSNNGSKRYDYNVLPHDHFLCTTCGILRDADVKDKMIKILESTIGDCQISGRLTISGICKKCKSKNEKTVHP